jgi:hypothetical protein
LPANILLVVAEKEGGKPGQWVRNSNDTYDVGPMQFNTTYLADLSRHGITAEHVAQPGCYSYTSAAWRIRTHIQNDRGDLWTKVGDYHSDTPHLNTTYQVDLMRRAAKWEKRLSTRFFTREVTFHMDKR